MRAILFLHVFHSIYSVYIVPLNLSLPLLLSNVELSYFSDGVTFLITAISQLNEPIASNVLLWGPTGENTSNNLILWVSGYLSES